ncbi:MAG: hypothetical protein HN348_30095 [Proteobacteria bacterium]|nr:hypothetical protein [Pseudomonadota bacterium]
MIAGLALLGFLVSQSEAWACDHSSEELQDGWDFDGDGFGGLFDCDDEDANLPLACPEAEGSEDQVDWCSDGLVYPDSNSIMEWVNQPVVEVDGREKGIREYLYRYDGSEGMPERCDVAMVSTRGGAQESNTEQLVRYVVEQLHDESVGYVLGGRSWWGNNASDWNFPNHAIDSSCSSWEGETRLLDVQSRCSTMVTLRRSSEYDPCGSAFTDGAIVLGGGQTIDEWPKGNLFEAFTEAVADGELPVGEVVDMDELYWAHPCRTGMPGRGCCNVANVGRQFVQHEGVQIIVPTQILSYGPACSLDDALTSYECSDLSSVPALAHLGDIIADVLNQPERVKDVLASSTGKKAFKKIAAMAPLSDASMLAFLESEATDGRKTRLIKKMSPVSDSVLKSAFQNIVDQGKLDSILAKNMPVSDEIAAIYQAQCFLGAPEGGPDTGIGAPSGPQVFSVPITCSSTTTTWGWYWLGLLLIALRRRQ